MKNLIVILLLVITVFSCNEKSDCTDTKCITCTSINITIEDNGSTYTCDTYDNKEFCVGSKKGSVCFPDISEPTDENLTIDDINAINAFWEENGGKCTFVNFCDKF